MSLSVKVARGRATGRIRQPARGRGDPGIFGDIFSGIVGGVKAVASVAKNVPGPIGWAGALVSGAGKPTASGMVQQSSPSGPSMPGIGFPQQPTPGLVGVAQRFLPGGQTGYQDVPAVGAPSGYHTNKTAYFLKDGTFIPEQSRWVKNRHRNPLNPRAASRAIGRLESLKKATARFSRITIRKKCA